MRLVTGEGEEYELRAPTEARFYDHEADAEIIAWRYVVFLCLNISDGDARLFAERRDIDTERVRRMLMQGASREVVRDIVL